MKDTPILPSSPVFVFLFLECSLGVKKRTKIGVNFAFWARFLIGGREGTPIRGYMVQTPHSEKIKNSKTKISKKEKIILSVSLYCNKMLYSLKFVVKFGLYCVKSGGVVVCTGVLIKVSYVAFVNNLLHVRAYRCICVCVIMII